MRAALAAALLFPTFVVPALASDGVLEINQACAVQTGCFEGDTAGFPVLISAPGSYRLTSNLTVPNENTDGVVVNASSVSIDLSGFEIAGPVTCSGDPLVCNPSSGTGSGVERTGSLNLGTSVKNGSITGMGSYGVMLGSQAEVTNLRVRWNRLVGIASAAGSTISNNTAYQNGSGIGVSGSSISGNSAYQNGITGIDGGSGSIISGNTSWRNGGAGIWVMDGSSISGNAAYQNRGDGIRASSGVTIIGNTVHDNGDSTDSALYDGIECINSCIVRGNAVEGNSGYGLNLGGDAAYSDNVVTRNATGPVVGAGSENGRGGNYCAGTGTVSVNCP